MGAGGWGGWNLKRSLRFEYSRGGGILKVYVYYESIKREPKIRGINKPKDRDEVNKREVCECDG